MKEPSFDSTPEFQHFKNVMRGVLAVPKARLDELVRDAAKTSARKGNPAAPGRKRTTAKRRSKVIASSSAKRRT
jgi:hypothetical protein